MLNTIKIFIELCKRSYKTKYVLQTLHSIEDKDIQHFVKVLQFVKKNKNWESEEINVLNVINKIRKDYSQSKHIVNIIDYGAGSPKALLSKDQMYEGVCKKINIADMYKRSSNSTKWSKLIFKLIREWQPNNCLELGTCLGISGAYQISALKINGKGEFTTIEGAKELAEIANSNLKKLNYPNYKVHSGRFINVLPSILSDKLPIDFLFIDGHHDKCATQEYYKLIYPFLSQHAIVIFDDIHWSVGMAEAWKSIYKNGKGIKVSFDMYKWGICFIDKENKHLENLYFQIAY